MSDKPNPYESPRSIHVETWWDRLRTLFGGSHAPSRTFADGRALICEGIAFFIDPANPSVAYAASPSEDHSSDRMNLIVSETIRVLPMFLADHPEVHEHLRERKLTVRMVDSYADARSACSRETPLEWNILDAILSDSPEHESEE